MITELPRFVTTVIICRKPAYLKPRIDKNLTRVGLELGIIAVKYPYGGFGRLDGLPTKKQGVGEQGFFPLKVVNRMPEGDERPLSERESESKKREEQGPLLSRVKSFAPLLVVNNFEHLLTLYHSVI